MLIIYFLVCLLCASYPFYENNINMRRNLNQSLLHRLSQYLGVASLVRKQLTALFYK